ncbi:serine protease 33-like [Amphiura filiformis]|uniref:serine protease 33-like n=1 Tax=Amphiura filiformis TaxID=82378 RepID=UPI003B222DDA
MTSVRTDNMKLSVFLLVIIFKLVIAWQDDPKCGLQTVDLLPETQIVGGQPAQEGEWPWQAALYAYGSPMCGASLVAPNWIITAAHCIKLWINPSSYELMLGSNSLTDISENSQNFHVLSSMFILYMMKKPESGIWH